MPVDLSAPIYAQYQNARGRAEEATQGGAWRRAAAAMRHCARLMRQYAEYAIAPEIRRQRLEKAQTHENAAAQLEQGAAVSLFDRPTPEVKPEDDYEGTVKDLIHRSVVQWEDIGGLEATKGEIKRAYGLALARPPEGVKFSNWRNILFYGPPGTGKTLLAAATSNGLEAAFFNVKVSDLLSKYFGDSSKLISALYRVAHRLCPSVIFLDEIEALTPQRGSSDAGVERRVVAALLPEMDGLATKESAGYVLSLAATNLPWLIDKAVLSRFEKKIYIPLPDEATRQAILRLHLEQRGHISEIAYADLAQRTAGFSGREIERLCKEAVGHMTERTNPDLTRQVDQGKAAISQYRLCHAPLDTNDFRQAFERVQPETTAADLARYDHWRKQVEE